MVQKVEGVKPSGHNTVTPAVELFLPPPVLTMENGRHAAEKDIFFGGGFLFLLCHKLHCNTFSVILHFVFVLVSTSKVVFKMQLFHNIPSK